MFEVNLRGDPTSVSADVGGMLADELEQLAKGKPSPQDLQNRVARDSHDDIMAKVRRRRARMMREVEQLLDGGRR